MHRAIPRPRIQRPIHPQRLNPAPVRHESYIAAETVRRNLPFPRPRRNIHPPWDRHIYLDRTLADPKKISLPLNP
jgi:hypothetical protein